MKQIQILLAIVLLLSCFHSAKINLSHYQKNVLARNLQTDDIQTALNPLLTQEPANHQQWRSQILNQVATLPKMGTPGQAIVFGNNAAVIVAGDTYADVLISAAEFGLGRIVFATHSGYLDNFVQSNNSNLSVRKLQQNIKKWVTKGGYTNATQLMDVGVFIKNTTNTTGVKALYWKQSTSTFTIESQNKVANFIKNGGGLFLAMTPWGWAQLKGSNDFTLALTYKIFLQAGITYNDQYIWGSSVFYTNKTDVNLSHFGIQTGIAMSAQNTTFDYTSTRDMSKQAKYLPYSEKLKLQSLIETSISQAELALLTPTKTNPIRSNFRKARIQFYQAIILENGLTGKLAPGLSNFPYDINRASFVPVQQQFSFTAFAYDQHQHTGYYAVAGQTVTINVIGSIPANWQVTLGFHYDDNSGQSDWIRWPTVFTSAKINKATVTITSPFGGLIVFKSPKGNSTLQVLISNIVEAPFYDSQKPDSVSDWARRKSAPGAWGCAQGLYVGFCFPRASFQNVNNPSQVLDFYDQIYLSYHNLRGTNPTLQRRQYILADIRPSAGYMHSGYPIVTHLDISDPTYSQYIFNYTSLTTLGQWGIFHEIGHNIQRSFWTYDGTGEVTNNIFSLRATQVAVGTSPKNANWLKGQKTAAKKYLLTPNWTTWKSSPGIALMIYAQVIEDFGWDILKRVFTSYEVANPSTLPATDQAQIDTFWAKTSIQAGENLTPLLTKWGIPFTNTFTDQVKDLPLYVQKVNLFA